LTLGELRYHKKIKLNKYQWSIDLTVKTLLYPAKIRTQIWSLESVLIEKDSYEFRIEIVLFFKKIRRFLDKNKKNIIKK
jgi:hypothetical protein